MTTVDGGKEEKVESAGAPAPELAASPVTTRVPPPPNDEPALICSRKIRPADRVIPEINTESVKLRRMWLGVMALVAIFFGIVAFTFWAPSDLGIDQNAYLVGGRMMAQHGSPRYELPNPFAFSGGMFVRAADGAYYPKYPIGLPILFAAAFWIFGAAKGAIIAFAISPASAVAAIVGMFFLAREVTSSFIGVIAAILLGTCQVMLFLMDNPNSHAPCVAFVAWGLYMLLRWWKTGSIWRGAMAGFFLAYACLIRYSEGLLVLPILVASLHRLRWTNWRSYLRNSVPLIAWAIPIALLAWFNKSTLGAWSGYDATHESEFGAAFTWTNFMNSWELTITTLYETGLFFILPIGLLGIGMLFRRSLGLGLAIALAFFPGVLLYTSYYFAMGTGMGFARFFLSFMPPAVLGAAVVFHDGVMLRAGENRKGVVPLAITVGLMTFFAAGMNVYRAVNGLEGAFSGSGGNALVEQYRTRLNLAESGRVLAKYAPARSVVFVGSGGGGGGGPVHTPINYIQFVGDYDVYNSTAFTGQPRNIGGPRFGGNDPNAPTFVSADQRRYIDNLYRQYDFNELAQEESRVINTALAAGRRVFMLGTPNDVSSFRNHLRDSRKFDFVTAEIWDDVAAIVDEDVRTSQPRRFGGPGGPGGPGGRGGPPGGGGGSVAAPNSWALLEVKLKKQKVTADN